MEYFLPMTTGVSKIASHIITLAAARTNDRTAALNGTDSITLVVQEHILYRFVVIIYRETSVLLCDISLISVVEPQFLLYV